MQRLQQEAAAGAHTVSNHRFGRGVRSCSLARSGCPPPGTVGRGFRWGPHRNRSPPTAGERRFRPEDFMCQTVEELIQWIIRPSPQATQPKSAGWHVWKRTIEESDFQLIERLKVQSSRLEQAKYGLRAIRVGEASHPGPPSLGRRRKGRRQCASGKYLLTMSRWFLEHRNVAPRVTSLTPQFFFTMIGRDGVTRPWHRAPVNKDTAKDRAAEQARVALHLRNPPCLGRDVVPIAPLQRPPTSAANTTCVPPSPDSSGCVAPSFFSPSAVQLRRGWRPFLQRTRRARVVRPTSCQLLRPLPQTQAIRNHFQPPPVWSVNSPKSTSLTNTFVATLAPASRQI